MWVIKSMDIWNFIFLSVPASHSSVTPMFIPCDYCSSNVRPTWPLFVPHDHCSSHVTIVRPMWSVVLCDVCLCHSWVCVSRAIYMHVLDVVSMWSITYYHWQYPSVTGLYHYLLLLTITYNNRYIQIWYPQATITDHDLSLLTITTRIHLPSLKNHDYSHNTDTSMTHS